MTPSQLSQIGEFELIERLKRALGPDLSRDIGDDCAVLAASASEDCELVTTDLLIEGIHFRRDWSDPESLGRKALSVNLSDIAAMGGTPRAAFLGCALPRELELDWVEGFFRGLSAQARESGVPISGGDTTASLHGISLSLTVLGSARRDRIRLRSTARAGDLLVVSDPLGDSAGGLSLLEAGVREPDPELTPAARRLLSRHLRPRALLAEGRALGCETSVTALMDLSDGIASDVAQLARASGLTARVDLDRIPLSPELRAESQARGWNAEALAYGGGEDYALLLAVAPEGWSGLQAAFLAEFGRPLFAIGRLTGDSSTPLVQTFRDGAKVAPPAVGFRHFS